MMTSILVVALATLPGADDDAVRPSLLARNVEAPFCYLAGGR